MSPTRFHFCRQAIPLVLLFNCFVPGISQSVKAEIQESPLPVTIGTVEIVRNAPRSLGLSNDRLVKVTFQNKGSECYVLDGSQARAVYGDRQVNALSEAGVIRSRTRRIGAKELAVAVVWVSSVGLYGDLAYDNLSKSKDPTVKYGRDEMRRKLTATRLGQRVLLPGEVSEGTIFLKAEPAMPKSIVVPVYVHPSMAKAGSLEILLEPGKNG